MSGIICTKLRKGIEDIMFVLTGGGSGIGKALAVALAKRGKEVLIIGRRKHLLEQTAKASPLIKCLQADISINEGIEAIKSYLSTIPQIEGLVNNSGIIEPIISLSKIDRQSWQKTLDTNLSGPLFLSQALLPQLSNGRILNIGSGAATIAIKGWGAYCVSKAALAMLTQCWQLESTDVFFTSIKPGITDTDMQTLARQGMSMDPEKVRFFQRLKDHNRLLSPDTVAEFLVWLLLDVDKDTYSAQEWDIYDEVHHSHWLRAPHQVLHWDF